MTDFIFVGSEIMCGSWNAWRGQGWHSDRGMQQGGSDLHELAWPRAKFMMYTSATRADCGALRVIPASHLAPLHGDLTRLIQSESFDDQTSHGELLPLLPDEAAATAPDMLRKQQARLDAGKLPWQFCFESNPGDALLFNHCLMHAVYQKPDERAFIAAKFAQRPRDQTQLALYRGYYEIDAHALAAAPCDRLRELAAREHALGGGRKDIVVGPKL